MQLRVLASGSSGNCYLVRSGTTCLMVDAGLSAASALAGLQEAEVAPEEVAGLLITHEHGDHAGHWKAVGAALPKADVWMSGGTWHALGEPAPGDGKGGGAGRLRTFDAGAGLDFGGLQVQTVAVPHDGRDPVCYRFRDGGGRVAGILSDLGHISPQVARHFSDCQILVLECNHDPERLRACRYPASVRSRIGGDWGHLSNQAAGAFLASMQRPPARVVACHLSEVTNAQDLVVQTLSAVVPEGVFSVMGQRQSSEWIGAAP